MFDNRLNRDFFVFFENNKYLYEMYMESHTVTKNLTETASLKDKTNFEHLTDTMYGTISISHCFGCYLSNSCYACYTISPFNAVQEDVVVQLL